MLEKVFEMLSYPFMVRAFAVGSLVALCSALLGVSLVLKRYSMIGDGLSHVGFGALAIAAAVNAATYGSDPRGHHSGSPSATHPGKQPDQRRRSDRPDFYKLSGCRRDGDLHDDRNEYRCVQLYVRKYPCHECRGCTVKCDLGCRGSGPLYLFLQQDIRHHI